MPSLTHEAIVQLLRERPELAPQLLELTGLDVPAHDEVRIESSDLSQTAPTEYRADLVVLLVEGEPVFGIVVEVQLAVKADKRLTWPVYVTTLRANVRCPTILLVITPVVAVARWASEPIEFGPGGVLAPVVLGPDAIPAIADLDEARGAPELAVLSAVAHAKDRDPQAAAEVALAAIVACLGLDTERGTFYADVVRTVLNDAARTALEELMQTDPYREYQSEFARKYVAEGKAEGRAEGEARAVLRLLERRGLTVSEEQRERVLSCRDLPTIEAWFDRAVVASSADELFA